MNYLLPLRWIACVLALLGCCFAATAQETAPAKAIIVFDASGSMYGQVPGGTKIVIAKKVVSDLVKSVDPSLELGLMAYGHREKANCEDIELLVPPAADSADEILKAVNALQPKGKTPLTDAVVQAAHILKFEESKVSVILVSDGEETCSKDPCVAAEELEKLGVDFTCHVVGFDLKPGQSSGLECLAQKTGGLYLAAKDSFSLKSALEAALQQIVKPVTTLVLEARASSGGPLIEGAEFTVSAKGQKPKNGAGGRWSVEIPSAGTYDVTATCQGKTQTLTVDVKEGETTTQEIVFAETGVKAVAYDQEGGTAFASGMSWELLGPPSADGTRSVVAYSYDPEPLIKAAPGDYVLKATRGEASASVEVTIAEGAPQQIQVILGTGNLKLSAISAQGQPPLAKGVTWEIYTPADAEGQRKKITYSYDPEPLLTLPSGAVHIVAKHGEAIGRLDAEVVAGKTQNLTISLGSGTLKLSALMADGGEPLTKGVVWRIYGEANEEGDRPEVSYSYDPEATFSIPAGTYEVAVSVDSAKVRGEVQVKAGQVTEQSFILGAGRLHVTASAAEGQPALQEGLSWEIFAEPDAEGESEKISYSYDPETTFSLAAGRYLLKVSWGQATVSTSVEITAGKLTETHLVLQAGTLKPRAIMGAGANPVSNEITWEVLGELDAEGERARVYTSYDAEPKVFLSAGRYLLRCKRGVAQTEVEIDINPGKVTSPTVNLNAGTIKFATSVSDIRWAFFGVPDADGERPQLYTSYDKEGRLFASTGKVLVVCEKNGKKAEREVEVKANSLTEVKLDPK